LMRRGVIRGRGFGRELVLVASVGLGAWEPFGMLGAGT